MMRHLLALIVWLAAASVSVVPELAHAQVGFDRPGGDYTSFVVRSGDPNACSARCERDARCRAWSFSYPVTENANALCWLKSEVTARMKGGCCVSGVRGAGVVEPRAGAVEFSIDRYGGDYRNLELPPDPTGGACKAACEAEGRCRAWTYARPGYIGTPAHCFLKDRIKPPHTKPCCISGVVR
jgi:PAN domain-containing protein